MTFDPTDFLYRVSLLICSSLDIDIALSRCREFISHFLPADAVYLSVYEPRWAGLRYIARADSRGGAKMDRIVPVAEDGLPAMIFGRRPAEHCRINQLDSDPLGRLIGREFELEGYSWMAQTLILADQRCAYVDLFGKGPDRYGEGHLSLFGQLGEAFTIALTNALQHGEMVRRQEQLIAENSRLGRELLAGNSRDLIGEDQGLSEVAAKIRQFSPLKSTVVLRGESGVGKEAIAVAVHRRSPRREHPFVRVNCGAIDESSLERELFGGEQGDGTDVTQRHRGRCECADKGTIFFNEIDLLPDWAQLRLLRLLQTGEIERTNGAPAIRLDIRLIAASHRDLQQLVEANSFRQDLWLRLNTTLIDIPPLRDRLADIPLLVLHFVKKMAMEMAVKPIPEVSLAGLERLMAEEWPGNVRQLANRVERELILDRLGPLHFLAGAGSGADSSGTPARSFRQPIELDSCVKAHIEEVLGITGGKINGAGGAAALLGVHPNTLRNRMKKLNICYGRRFREGIGGSLSDSWPDQGDIKTVALPLSRMAG